MVVSYMPKTTPATQLLNWYEKNGRKNLPWRKNISAYRVWLSEIMLQQTQVITVIPYFERFIKEFPNIKTLAESPIDKVLYHWSGLGYYSRARNLHQTAKIIAEQFNGKFPNNFDDLIKLPGIGRSTAGAILAIAYEKKYPILEGNVKRIILRLKGIQQIISTDITKQLWQESEKLLPEKQNGDFTQAIMDLGATVCTRSKPKCPLCPWKKICIAYQKQLTDKIPAKKPSKKISERSTIMWLIQRPDGAIYLRRRPLSGVWAKQWCFPETFEENDLTQLIREIDCQTEKISTLDKISHTFSHYRLTIQPYLVQVKNCRLKVMANDDSLWYKNEPGLPLAAPVKSLWNKLNEKNLLP